MILYCWILKREGAPSNPWNDLLLFLKCLPCFQVVLCTRALSPFLTHCSSPTLWSLTSKPPYPTPISPLQLREDRSPNTSASWQCPRCRVVVVFTSNMYENHLECLSTRTCWALPRVSHLRGQGWALKFAFYGFPRCCVGRWPRQPFKNHCSPNRKAAPFRLRRLEHREVV